MYVLMIFIVQLALQNNATSAFSTEFNDLQACKSAYVEFVKITKRSNSYTEIYGVCVKKGSKGSTE